MVTSARAIIDAGMSEAEFQYQIIQLARTLGYLVYHPYDSRKSAPGFPDLVIAGHGAVIFLECKRENGKATAAQRQWIQTLVDAGELAYIVKPSDWSLIEDVLLFHRRASQHTPLHMPPARA